MRQAFRWVCAGASASKALTASATRKQAFIEFLVVISEKCQNYSEFFFVTGTASAASSLVISRFSHELA